ncbi:hypothetical protein UFOVP1290_21 [uncultured Caudovirales phage]|uniref:Uncharacterized protein n=1 Tax=uncultured Caudovirales phage TaxID=2100421 RepID=A0A6J5RSG5_9CAUD|nr:hypothetical protein UFOVP1290_21 [uncultured Caudovirales phage]
MKKLNHIVYNKLLLQAEEAKHQQLTKLASNILDAVSDGPDNQLQEYASIDMDDDINAGLWKLATCVLKHHNVLSVDAEKLNEVIESFANKFVNDVQTSVCINSLQIGELEPKLPGQSK